jgi:hypothetical protein
LAYRNGIAGMLGGTKVIEMIDKLFGKVNCFTGIMSHAKV